MIKIHDVGLAHSLLVKFCRDVEKLYGTQRITPNMHMHTHLADCILDYGPVYSFWLFSFERYNGILGNYSNNNKSIELQIMRKFLRDQNLRELEFPKECVQHFSDLTDKLQQREGHQSCSEVVDSKLAIDILHLCDGRLDIRDELWFTLDGYSIGLPHVIEQLDCDEHEYLSAVYKIFLPDIPVDNIPYLYDKYASIEFSGERYGSEFSRLSRFAYILARWAGRFHGGVDMEGVEERPGIIDCFVRQSISYRDKVHSFCFAHVRWFQRHPERFHYGNDGVTPEIWCSNLFESFGPASFIPVQRIARNLIPGYDKVDDETVLFVMPLERRILL
ncbi:uncharacterized protein LOC114544841 [Dendronephthya gigantea]|uniref:uncharacterized protein LOC114544841 n=1 Tax=Dendronephthya gigantea TaxID=151771 RepID=UPI00106B9F59|nr:uncharacterized protein LOC114544841 [Dendronephthya gigantea]